jgi:hypothetical protein
MRVPAAIERVRETKCEMKREKLEKWMTAIHRDLLAGYQGAAQDVQP